MNTLLKREFWLDLAGACVIAIVAAVPIVMSADMQRGFEIGKLALAQPLAILAAGAVLMGARADWLARRDAPQRLALYALAAFCVLATISTVLAAYPEVALFGSYDRREGLLAWLTYGAFFIAVCGATDRRDGVERFVDVMLVASAVPAAYALQQRLQWDFYPLGMRDPTRAGGTLGGPVFLAAYLAAVIPLTISRCLQARPTSGQCAFWCALLLTQVGGILVTQTRGPLVALVTGLVLFALCVAGRKQAKRTFAGALAALALIALFIATINLFVPAQRWAQGVPVLSRLVFTLDLSASAQTQGASRSALSRVLIWRAGVATFQAAPLERQLLGYGPDSAVEQFFPHVPPAVVRLIGYGEEHAFDRMHADVLDILLNFGAIAWLAYALFFGAVMYAAAEALGRGRRAVHGYVASVIGAGTLSAAAVYLIGYPAAAAPAFGLGCGVGVFLFLAASALRALREPPSAPTPQWILLAGLTTALWGFWMDAQISVPVPTTRLIACALAALILVVAARIRRGEEAGTALSPRCDLDWRAFGFACIAVATLGTCLPDALYDPSPDLLWLRRMAPILSLLIATAAAIFMYVRGNAGVSARRAALIATVPAFVYLVVHVALIAQPRDPYKVPGALAISIASVAATAFIGLLCVLFACRKRRVADAAPSAAPGGWRRTGIALAIAAGLFAAYYDWQARRAEVAFTLASQVASTQSGLSEQLMRAAIYRRPFERYYYRQLAIRLLGYALGGMLQLESTPPQSDEFRVRLEYVVRQLAAAETMARAGMAIFSRDPWMTGALANVLQIRALRALRPLDPDGSIRAAREADRLFAKAHRIFPSEPLILRNWGQFLAEQGDLEAAYGVFDRMEALIPDDIAAYAARIEAARGARDATAVEAALIRAKKALQPILFNQLVSVVSAQQSR
ncbi:MAG: O-antigen ligase family protein [Betaproteobacteria bacterium]